MRVRASIILTFALLSAPALNAAGATATSARIPSKSREHPVSGKTVKAAAVAAKTMRALPARASHVPERLESVRPPSRVVSVHGAKAIAKAEPVQRSRGTHLPAAEAVEREPERKRAVAELSQVKGRGVALDEKSVHGRAARAEPEKVARTAPEKLARVTPAPLLKVIPPQETASASPVIESDPEALHVVHDRKVHHGAEEGAPHLATPFDFTTVTPAKPAETAPDQPPPLKPVATIVRRTKVSDPPVATVKPALLALEAPVTVPMLYLRGKLVIPPALKGSHEILVHQNEMADADGLGRIQNDDDLEAMRSDKLLVPIPAVQGIQIDERLPVNRRYCRPWTAQFLAAVARAHYARFHSALQVNSAVRTVEFQQRLLLTNGNAAPAEGETASPHLTGQAVDLAKKGLSMTEIAWLRGYLLPLVQEGKVDVEEEFQQACFHVSVYKKYMPQPVPKREIAPHRTAATALAAALP